MVLVIPTVVSLTILHSQFTALVYHAIFTSGFAVFLVIKRVVLGLTNIDSVESRELLSMVNPRYILDKVIVDFRNNTL